MHSAVTDWLSISPAASTATQCAEVAGLSPSGCSYHLRALARHGFVLEDADSAADGRHRPWRARAVSFSLPDNPGSPAVRTAGRLLLESVQARSDEIRADYLDRESEYPALWRAAAGLHQDILHVTAEELADVRSRVQAVLSDYRRLDAAGRPADSRRVHVIFDLTPWFRPDGES